jgi:2-polyprenyl-3-methyl-5-hydroxy-6-metoxy-1,4-benzoquinol methylase
MRVEETWYDKFRKHLNVMFTEEDFEIFSNMVKEDLPTYRKYLKEGARILYVGSGVGCTSVPLSREGFEVVGIDNDPSVIAAAKQNGKKFGGKLHFILMDAYDIDEEFEEDTFDACLHGGLLEHYSKAQIGALLDKQLIVSPLVMCSVPVRTERTLEHYKVKKVEDREICVDGIERNLWTEEQWTEDVLKDYNIVESRISKCIPRIGNFDELFLVIRR